MIVFKSEPSGFDDNTRPPARSRKKRRAPAGASFFALLADFEWVVLMQESPSRHGVSIVIRADSPLAHRSGATGDDPWPNALFSVWPMPERGLHGGPESTNTLNTMDS